jgi:hypothetical protein
MPLARTLLVLAFVGAVVALVPPLAAEAQECVEVTQPNNNPPPNEITIGLYCPGDDDTGSPPPPTTPVAGGGGSGPTCEWWPSPFHIMEMRNTPDGIEVWWMYHYRCDDSTVGDTWLCTSPDLSVSRGAVP